MGYGTKPAVPGTHIAHDHKGRRLPRIAFRQIRAMCFLTYGMQPRFTEQCGDFLDIRSQSYPFFQPGRFPRLFHIQRFHRKLEGPRWIYPIRPFAHALGVSS